MISEKLNELLAEMDKELKKIENEKKIIAELIGKLGSSKQNNKPNPTICGFGNPTNGAETRAPDTTDF